MGSRLFGTNGVRGLANKEITPEFVSKLGSAIGTFFKGGNIFIGYDGRTSSPMLMQAAISGLVAAGCNVNDVGMAPTPAIQYAVRHYKPDGGVIITASHNPPEFNGIKVLGKDGVEISRDDELKIESIYFNEKFKQASWDALGRISTKSGILETYNEAVKANVGAEKIKKKHFHVVMDLANGAGALIFPQILRELDCKITTINSNVDGHFPGRLPEPRPEYLTELSKIVVAVKADIGVAYDGDADRSLFCDENGEIIWGDESSAIIMEYILRKNPKSTVVTSVSSSKLIEDVAKRYGAKVLLTKVGSVEISNKMKEVNSIFGCEENGGCFYGPHQPVRDGAMTTLLMLQVLAESDKTLSQL
ncbi:MAG TPA: phosphoglucosamine mutase, partial [archaeon]|nr:phosphoglucosamine mutase [archaeon]